MRTFRLLWNVHKWTGIGLGAVLLLSAGTGLLLLVKKDYPWLQPETLRGTDGPPERIAPMHEVYAAAFALGLPQLRNESDIERIDFRPEARVFKIRVKRDDLEVQVDAIGLRAHGPFTRTSDWLERVHDGQWLGALGHGWLMPLFSVGIGLLVITGYLVWLWPKLLKRRKRATRA